MARPDYAKCPICGKELPEEEMQDHVDYDHIMDDLDDIEGDPKPLDLQHIDEPASDDEPTQDDIFYESAFYDRTTREWEQAG